MHRTDRYVLRLFFNHLRICWKRLVVTDVVYKLLAFAFLSPFLTLLYRTLIAASGSTVLADEDLLFFFLHPLGWICMIVGGGVWVGVAAMELSALMTVVVASQQGKAVQIYSALRFTLRRTVSILRLAGRAVAFSLAAAAPFLAVLAFLYAKLLTEFDINYYLAEHPPELWLAAGLGAAIGIAMIALLGYLIAGWTFALPILLFQNVVPSQALSMSSARTSGQRWALTKWIVGWWLASMALSSIGNGLVLSIGRLIVPYTSGSLALVILVVGTLIVIWAVVNFMVTLASAVTFAVLLVSLCRHHRVAGELSLPDSYVAELTGPATGLSFTRKRVVLALGLLLGLAVASGGGLVMSIQLEDHTQVTAHRGASAVAPENTHAAVRQAIADGADSVEIDVQESADGKVVVVHDGDLKRIGGVNLRIRETSAEELRQVDIGSWFGTEFKNERMPTLDEVLAECKGKIRVNIELKYYGRNDRLEERVVQLVEARGMEEDVVVMSLKRDAVNTMNKLRPEWEVGLLTAVSMGDLTKIEADFFAVSTDLATRGFIRRAHRQGKDVYVWTVNDAVTMSIMMSRGVDNIITDKPALARSVLGQRAEMSSAERLLIEIAGLLGANQEVEHALGDS